MSFALWHIGAIVGVIAVTFTMGYLTGKNEAVSTKEEKAKAREELWAKKEIIYVNEPGIFHAQTIHIHCLQLK